MGGHNKNFTVLGAGGFVGTHLVRYLEAQGMTVSVPERGDQSIFQRPLGHVIYCIGLTADYLARPFDTVEAHVSFFSRLLRDADYESVVYLSSTRLYDSGGPSATEINDLILNPADSRHLYDFSKGLGESLCNECGDGRARVARLSCVYADDLSGDNFLHRLVAQALSQDHIALETHLGAARDYVHIDDVCNALVNIATRGTRLIYNVASGINVTNRVLFDTIEDHTGCRIMATAPATGDAGAAPAVDVTALREDFGLLPREIRTALPVLIAANRADPEPRRAAS
jgi:nucleoside-diphosphate-sugar epimerase